jgi:IS605 OrfB family transposase
MSGIMPTSSPPADESSSTARVKAIKSVKFQYSPTELTRDLLEIFRKMVNDAIRICIKENISGRLRLRDRIYKEFQERYGVLTCYPYSVAEVAWSIAKKHQKWNRKPFATRLMMKMDVQNYSLNFGILSLPFKKGGRLLIPLEYGEYQRSFLMDNTLKRGSITITEAAIYIAFSKEVPRQAPLSHLGVDLNQESAVCSDGTRYGLSEIARLHTEYGIRRRNFDKAHPKDRRLRRKFAGSRRERERVRQALNVISKQIVEKAAKNGEVLVLEKLKGIRKTHQKGNGMGRGSRRRAHHWPFSQLQNQISHKAAWAGVAVEFVSPLNTSKVCSQCGLVKKELKLSEREWRCPCGAILDRDLNAAINIARRGKIPCLGEVRPEAQGMNEAVKGNEAQSAPILQAEALKLSLRRQP